MTAYLKPSFTVGMPGTQSYRDNWDAIFRKSETEPPSIGHWNYRVVQTVDGFNIREVYYDDLDQPLYTTEGGSDGGFGETLDELRRDTEYIAKALELPVLRYPEDFKQ